MAEIYSLFMNSGFNTNSQDCRLLSDQNLYQLCKTYGERARLWRQKFAGLLPEVFKRKLYEKKGFSSIFEFAKKLAGMSEEQVRRVLNLDKKFENLSKLKSLLINGDVSVNKLARVASIANSENEEFLAENVKNLSKSAVETLVRDEKAMREKCGVGGGSGRGSVGVDSQDGLFEPKIEAKSVPGHKLSGNPNLQLSPEVQQKLLELQQKGIDINNLLLNFLQKREQEISNQKEQIIAEIIKKSESPTTRPIPKVIKTVLYNEYGTKCSIQHCRKPSVTIHHTQRFALSGNHNPYYLAPLCKEHHELAHSIDVNYHKMKYR